MFKIPPSSRIQEALDTPLDNTQNDFDSDNVQEGLEEIDFRQLVKEPTGFENRVDSIFSFDDITRTFTIERHDNGPFSYWIRGHKFTVVNSASVIIPDTEGNWFIYFEGDTLVASQTLWDFEDPVAFVSLVYWDAANSKHVRLIDERHQLVMDWATHKRLHSVIGAQIEPGGFVIGDYIEGGDGSLDAHSQFSISDGYIHDEDVICPVVNAVTPVHFFEQKLSPIGEYAILYLEGTGNVRLKEANQYPLIDDNPNTPKYNKLNGGTWSLENVTDGYYFVMWVLVTTDVEYPVVELVGHHQSADLLSASDANKYDEVITKYPSGMIRESVSLHRVIYQADSSYTNYPKARIVAATTIEVPPVTNDRYNVAGWYIGNAGTGKYIEWYKGSGSDESPFVFPENSFVRTVTIYTTALNTGTIGFFKLPDVTTPVFTITLTNERKSKFTFSERFNDGDELAARVISGSFNNPTLRLYPQTSPL